MIPAVFVTLHELPLTPNGKIDRRALPVPERGSAGPERAFVAPRTPRESLLAAVWAEVLGAERVGIHDNFFSLGGHSLLAVRLLARLRAALQVVLPLRSLFEAPTVAGMAAAIDRGQGDADGPSALPAIIPDPARRYEPFPLTDIQQAYWIGRSGAFELGNVATHSYLEIEATGLDLERLACAWRRLIERHDMLRAIVRPDGQQQILDQVPPYTIETLDLREQAPPEVEARLAEVRQRMSHQVLPSDRWPLFEIRAARLDDNRTLLQISTDALISDAWSRLLLARELIQLYEQPDATLVPLELSFRDYVLAEAALRKTGLYRRALAYWRGRLDRLPPAPELPLAKNPGALDRPRFVRRSERLAPDRWRSLKAQAARAGLTPSGVVLAAFAEVLTAWSKHPRFTLNLTLFNRLPMHPQVDDIMGDFTSVTLLAVDNTAREPFTERARRLQAQLWEDLDHRYVGGVQVLRELGRARGGAGRAAMPVVFTSTLTQGGAGQALTALGRLGRLVYSISQTPQVWLDHQVSEDAGALVFNWDAVEGLFPAGMLQDIFDAYCRLLERLIDEPAEWQGQARQLVPEAQLALRQRANATTAPFPDGLLHTLFAAQVPQRPEQPAVITSTRCLTYAELHRRATRLGRRLRGLGARPNTLVAIVMEKGWEQVVAALGILWAGAAYLPIDAGLPAERLHYLLEHAEASLLITQPWLDERLAWPAHVRRLCVADQEEGTADDSPLAPVQTPQDLAYVIYTSGSTGLPKGVMIDHRGAVNTIVDLNQRFDVRPSDRVLALSALSFDLSVYDVFGFLAAGGTIVIPDAAATRDPAHWARLMARERVTIWNSVPTLLAMLVEYLAGQPGGAPLALRLALLSGDWIPVTLPDQARALVPDLRVISLGGATEASIWSILYPITTVDPDWKSIPYGTPMVNQTFHVLNEHLEPCPVWVPGQLYIGGIGLALGYWRDPARTAERFIPNPFERLEIRDWRLGGAEEPISNLQSLISRGTRLYKTGDLGRYLPDGTIEFLGREDFQVKIQGYRIELGEIEAALAQHPAVRTVAVAAVGAARGGKRLVAYVVPAQEQRTQNKEQKDSQEPRTENREPALFPPSSNGGLLDPRERLAYKRGQPGLRPDAGQPGVQLNRPAIDDALIEAYVARRSYRAFQPDVIPFAAFSALLGCLLQIDIPGAPFPKRRYGSAGSIYPVQTYLYVKPGRVEGLDAGTYYYAPHEHRLVPLAPGATIERVVYTPANRPVFQDAAFAVFLVGQMRAIVPLYGEHSLRFATLEAGIMTQLLEQAAPKQQIGLCQAGTLDFERIRHLFALDEGHVFLHGLLGGRIALEQTQLAGFLTDAGAYHALLEAKPDAPTYTNGSAVEHAMVRAPAGDRGLVEDLRGFLRAKLPEYMVPAAFVLLDALPLTPNGKLDRKALPDPDESSVAPEESYVAPRSDIERAIAAVLQEVLGVERVGVEHNFFDLGGNSLHLVQAHARLQQALDREIALVEMFNHPTVSALAAYLSRSGGEAPAPQIAARDEQLQAGKQRLGKLLKKSST